MSDSPLTIGVHESGLARAQAEVVARRLVERGVPYSVHLEILEGEPETEVGLHHDHIAENRSRLSRLHALLRDGEVDVVIHRGFDLRGEVPSGLRIAAVLERGNPYDVLVAPGEVCLDELEDGDRVGVVQLRARAQLMEYRPELEWELITGDVSHWLTALIDGSVDALVAPGAAIEHLALQERVCEIFPPEMLVPAPGSGVLLCLCREEDDATCRRLHCLHHPPTAAEYEAECALMDSLEGRWEHPIGALAQCLGDEIAITAMVSSADGTTLLRENHIAAAEDPTEVGCELAALLIQAGAERLLHEDAENATDQALRSLAGLLAPSTGDDLEDAQWDFESGGRPSDEDPGDEEADW